MSIELSRDSSGGRNLVILVVDDDVVTRLQIRYTLENQGVTVVEAATGLEALDYFRNNPVDLIFLDVVMPGIDGLMACREIRSLPDGVHLPVVMITGLEDRGTINEAFDAGATDFITKPINLLILGYRVRYWLRSGAVLHALQINQRRLFKAQQIARLGHWEKNLENDTFQLTCHAPEVFGLAHPCSYDDLFSSIVDEDKAGVRQELDAACGEGASFRIKYRIRLADGSVRTLRNQGEVTRNCLSKTPYLIGVIQDITEQEMAEECLRCSEKKWRVIFERTPVGIALFDNESTIVECNEHFTALFNFPRSGYIGVNLMERLPAGRMRDTLQAALQGEGGHHYEGLHTSFQSGKEVYLNVIGERVSPDLLVVVVADFTEQRQAILARKELPGKP